MLLNQTFRTLAIVLIGCLLWGSVGLVPSYAQEISLPLPGQPVPLSSAFAPPIVKGLKIDPSNPLRFEFILSQGQSSLSRTALREQANTLVKYFLAGITTPEQDLWVNLSPYEKDRIIPDRFGQTEMGRDLLACDYLLKQVTASLIDPEGTIGKAFWNRVYSEAAKRAGARPLPVSTFHKVWIVPDRAVVYENWQAGVAYVVESSLKVMLEADYLALHKQARAENSFSRTNEIVRSIVIPALTLEVNQGRNFAPLRQLYNSLILAMWYKKKVKDSLLSLAYADRSKVAGINTEDPQVKSKIYDRYLQAFKKGVFNYVKQDVDPISQKPIAHKYFSGGAVFDQKHLNLAMTSTLQKSWVEHQGDLTQVTVDEVGIIQVSRLAKDPQELRKKAEELVSTFWGAHVLTAIKEADNSMVKGGIDFQADKLRLEIQNEGQTFRLRPDVRLLRQLEEAEGVTPIVVKILPLWDLRSFLGVAKLTEGAKRPSVLSNLNL